MITLKVPFQIDATGKVATVSGRRDEIRQQVVSLANTRVRERVMRPSFGTRAFDFLFDPLDGVLVKGLKDDLRDSITRHIPEIQITSLEANVRDTTLELEFGYTIRDVVGASTVDLIEIDVGGTVNESSDVSSATRI